MSNFDNPAFVELGAFIEGQLSLIKNRMDEAAQPEMSELWGQQKQLLKIKTWLHWYESQRK
jgi:hypothetical protein